MRIGVNCLKIHPTYAGGLNTYTLGLIEALVALDSAHHFFLYVSSKNQNLFSRYAGRQNVTVGVFGQRGFAARKAISQATLLLGSRELYRRASNWAFRKIQAQMEAACDVIYTPTVSLQSFDSRRPTVLSMHDLQHLHYPEFLSWPRRLSRRMAYQLSAEFGDYFQASSEFIRQDMLTHFPEIAAERIEVIPEGVHARDFSQRRDVADLRSRYQLPERFLFYPAQLWPHKNHITLLKALKQIELRQGVKIPLMLTGASYSAAESIMVFVKAQGMGYVQYLGVVPFEDLVGLYQAATFVVAAGLYESNSLPVLEAAAAGTPVIASRIPPNEELSSTLKLNLFNTVDAADLAGLITSLWSDGALPRAQAAHNRAHIHHFSWENAARKYVDWFERIGDGTRAQQSIQ